MTPIPTEDRTCEICHGTGSTKSGRCERCSGTGKSVLSEKDKIQILLAEYNVLQAEIINRMNNGFQIWGGGLAVLGVMVSLKSGQNDRKLFWLFFAAVITAVAVASWITVRDQLKAVRRVKALEAEINWRAKERLLIHQSYLSAYNLGFWSFLFKSKPPAIDDLPPEAARPPRFFYP